MERTPEHAPALQYLLDLLRAGLARAPAPAPRGIDPDLLVALIRHHRLAPWAGPLLSMAGLSSVRGGLRAELQRSAVRRMAAADELRALCAAFAAAGVPALALKGPALSLQLFGDPLRRASRDLDFLVPPAAEAAARRILAEHGYGRMPSDIAVEANAVTLLHHEKPPVELHVRFSEVDRLFPVAPLRLFERPTMIELGGTAIATLPVEVAVAYAAFHGAKHHWARLYWLADIAMACRRPDLDWGAVERVARQTGTDRHLALAAGLARDWLGSPQVLAEPRGHDRSAIRRSRALLPEIVAPPPRADHEAVARVGRRRILAAELGLARGWAKLAVLLGRLQPTSEDRRSVLLPERWAFLYYAIHLWRRLSRPSGARR